ncbi:ABC transporter permease [Thermoproteota archaeon]
MSRYTRVWKKSLGLAVAEDMAYKGNFIIKCFALILVDMIGPLIAVLIYTSSSGIPGWSLAEFILFTGTITLVLGIGHALMFAIPWYTISAVRRGEFDKYLIKPFNPLVYLSLSAWDLEGFAEVGAGLLMVGWALTKLWVGITIGNILLYIFLILVGCVFIYSCMVLIASASFLFVKTFGLFDLFFNITKFARYPLNVFGSTTRIFFTFLFPLAIAAHYPTTALLHGMPLLIIVKVVLPVIAFFGLTLFLWSRAMKKYSSAGG